MLIGDSCTVLVDSSKTALARICVAADQEHALSMQYRYYRGRGAFESMGTGIEMLPGDIAFKCNFATLDTSTGIVTSRRADRRFEDMGPIFCKDLNGMLYTMGNDLTQPRQAEVAWHL